MSGYVVHVAVLVGALLGLVKSAEWLVDRCAKLAKKLDVSEIAIGLTLMAVGTSLPEVVSSIFAAADGFPGLAIGNIAGSNLANIGIVLGAAALIARVAISPKTLDRDGMILLVITIALYVLSLDGCLGRWDAAILLSIYFAYLVFISKNQGRETRLRDFARFYARLDYVRPALRVLTFQRHKSHDKENARPSVKLDIVVILASCALLAVSAHFLVREAVWVALTFELSPALIGFAMIALGTSVPELFVAVSAARKGNGDLVIGSLIGSNIANTGLVGGITGLIAPIDIEAALPSALLPVLTCAMAALLYLLRSTNLLTRWHGLLLIGLYIGTLALFF